MIEGYDDWVNHPFLKDARNRDEMGNIKDGSICPRCKQPREGKSFYSKKHGVYLPACLGCRRAANQYGWVQTS